MIKGFFLPDRAMLVQLVIDGVRGGAFDSLHDLGHGNDQLPLLVDQGCED